MVGFSCGLVRNKQVRFDHLVVDVFVVCGWVTSSNMSERGLNVNVIMVNEWIIVLDGCSWLSMLLIVCYFNPSFVIIKI